MLLKALIFMKQGEVNGVFTSRTPEFTPFDEDYDLRLQNLVIEELRRDHEKNTYGPGVPDENPSLDPATVSLLYTACTQRQELYALGFPIVFGTYDIIDAFVCMGSRFGLKQLQVFVEVCRSRMGGKRMWANIYYVADSEKPACTIEVLEYEHFVNPEWLRGRIQRLEARRQQFALEEGE